MKQNKEIRCSMELNRKLLDTIVGLSLTLHTIFIKRCSSYVYNDMESNALVQTTEYYV